MATMLEAPRFDEQLATQDVELEFGSLIADLEVDITLFEEKAERIISVPFMGGTGNKSITPFGSGTADDWDDWD